MFHREQTLLPEPGKLELVITNLVEYTPLFSDLLTRADCLAMKEKTQYFYSL